MFSLCVIVRSSRIECRFSTCYFIGLVCYIGDPTTYKTMTPNHWKKYFNHCLLFFLSRNIELGDTILHLNNIEVTPHNVTMTYSIFNCMMSKLLIVHFIGLFTLLEAPSIQIRYDTNIFIMIQLIQKINYIQGFIVLCGWIHVKWKIWKINDVYENNLYVYVSFLFIYHFYLF